MFELIEKGYVLQRGKVFLRKENSVTPNIDQALFSKDKRSCNRGETNLAVHQIIKKYGDHEEIELSVNRIGKGVGKTRAFCPKCGTASPPKTKPEDALAWIQNRPCASLHIVPIIKKADRTMVSIESAAQSIKDRFHADKCVFSKSTSSIYVNIPRVGEIRISDHATRHPCRFNMSPDYLVSEWRDGKFYTSTFDDLVHEIRIRVNPKPKFIRKELQV